MPRGALASALHSAKKAVLGRKRGTRRWDRLLKIEDKMEALRLKRYKARIARRKAGRMRLKKLSTPSYTKAVSVKTGVVVNPYQSCCSKAVRTFILNVPGSLFAPNGNYFNSGVTTDLSGSVSMTQCGLSAYWLRSIRSPDYVYLGLSAPLVDIRFIEDTNTLQALAQLYQYFKIKKISLQVKFDMGNVKDDDRTTNNEVGTYEHFSYPSQKGEVVNISSATGIMSDSAWEFVKEQGIKQHKTGSSYLLSWKPRFQLDPKAIIGTGTAIPFSVGNRSVSMDDIVAGNIPRMPSPACVFKLRLPETESAEMSVEVRLTVDYKNGGRLAYGFDPTVPY